MAAAALVVLAALVGSPAAAQGLQPEDLYTAGTGALDCTAALIERQRLLGRLQTLENEAAALRRSRRQAEALAEVDASGRLRDRQRMLSRDLNDNRRAALAARGSLQRLPPLYGIPRDLSVEAVLPSTAPAGPVPPVAGATASVDEARRFVADLLAAARARRAAAAASPSYRP